MKCNIIFLNERNSRYFHDKMVYRLYRPASTVRRACWFPKIVAISPFRVFPAFHYILPSQFPGKNNCPEFASHETFATRINIQCAGYCVDTCVYACIWYTAKDTRCRDTLSRYLVSASLGLARAQAGNLRASHVFAYARRRPRSCSRTVRLHHVPVRIAIPP